MIGWLQGNILDLQADGMVLLDVQGVGYQLLISTRNLERVSGQSEASFFVHTHVREDAITLFGFTHPEEKSLFSRLITVSGIGARTAMSMLSSFSSSDLMAAIEDANIEKISQTPGIGKKTAQRLVLELRGKLNILEDSTPAASPMIDELRSALANLGYKHAQIEPGIKKLDPQMTFEEALKSILKAMR